MTRFLIVDFGSQVTQLIARRVREEGVYSEIVPFQKAEAAFAEMKPKAVILSGGPELVHEAGSPRAPQAIFDLGVPVLGICYGQMTMAAQLGGTVEGGHHREFGRADVEVKAESQLFDSTWGMGERHPVWMSHGDRITKMPPGFVVAGTSANAPFAVIQDEKRRYYGLMFHPEVVHTPDGAKLIRNFVRKVAGLNFGVTAKTLADSTASSAVVAAVAPICVDQFQRSADATDNLTALKKTDSWQQAAYVEKGGWAMMPGSKAVHSGVPQACAALLNSLK